MKNNNTVQRNERTLEHGLKRLKLPIFLTKSGERTVTSELFDVSDTMLIATGSVGRDPITPPTNPPIQEAGPRVVICQVSSAGRREVFLNPSKVRRLLDARVLERRGDLSAWLIKHRWSGALLGDGWMLEISVPLSDNEGSQILSSLTSSDGPGSPAWECGDDKAPEFV